MNRKTILRILLLLPMAAAITAAALMGAPEITGQAVQDIVQSEGAGTALITIIAAAAILGISAYTTISAISEIEDAICMHSKYWAGYAMQKVEPAHKKKAKTEQKTKPEVVFENNTPTMFCGIAKGIGNAKESDWNMPDKIPDSSENPQKGSRTGQRISAEENDTINSAADIAAKNEKEMADKAEDISKKTSPDKTENPPEAERNETPAAKEEPKETTRQEAPKTAPRDRIGERFGTTDPFEIAQKILKRRG
jgi:hypothetical protein